MYRIISVVTLLICLVPGSPASPQEEKASIEPADLKGTWAGSIWRHGQTGAIRPLRLKIDVQPDGLLVFSVLSSYWLSKGTISWTGTLNDNARIQSTLRYGFILDGVRHEYDEAIEGKVISKKNKLIMKLSVEQPPYSRRREPKYHYIKVKKE